MGLYSNYPFTNYHELNLDWLIEQMRGLVQQWDAMEGNVTADAYTSISPQVTVTGNLKNGLNFSFGLVRGQQGIQGPEGPQGQGLEILDVLSDPSDLPATGNVGDVYEVLDGGDYHLYVWSESNSSWIDTGSLGTVAPSSSTPLMDGVGAAGSSTDYARGDHVHPSDTSKQDVLVSGTDIQTINGSSILTSGNLSLQETLVAGTNIKTINTNSILGSGDISLQPTLVSGTDIKTINGSTILTSGNLDLQPQLNSGVNIKTVNSTSLLGSGNIAVQPTLENEVNIKSINGNNLLGSGTLALPTILYGSTPPSAGDGEDGDIYVEYSL